MPRSDTHRVSVADPAEYVEAGYFDLHPEEGGGRLYDEVLAENGLTEWRDFSGNFEARGRCDHCGAGPLRYVVVFLHVPSGETVSVGERCAEKLALESRSAFEHRRTVEQARTQRKRVEFDAADPRNVEAAEYLATVPDGRDHFLNDLERKLHRYGYLTERQVDAVLRSKARGAEYRAKREAEAKALESAEPLAEGRRLIAGEVLSTKWQESEYGDTLKMLVKEDDGNKVWGTVPQALQDAIYDLGTYRIERPSMPGPDVIVIFEDAEGWTVRNAEDEGPRPTLKGRRVEFTATVERSRDDQHFGFYKRPSGARLAEPSLFEEVS